MHIIRYVGKVYVLQSLTSLPMISGTMDVFFSFTLDVCDQTYWKAGFTTALGEEGFRIWLLHSSLWLIGVKAQVLGTLLKSQASTQDPLIFV